MTPHRLILAVCLTIAAVTILHAAGWLDILIKRRVTADPPCVGLALGPTGRRVGAMWIGDTRWRCGRVVAFVSIDGRSLSVALGEQFTGGPRSRLLFACGPVSVAAFGCAL